MKRRICVVLVVLIVSGMLFSCAGKSVSVNGGEGFAGKISFTEGSAAFDGIYAGMKQKDVIKILRKNGYKYYTYDIDQSMKYAGYISVDRKEYDGYEYSMSIRFDEKDYTLTNMEIIWEIPLPDSGYPSSEDKKNRYNEVLEDALNALSGSFGNTLFSDGEKQGYSASYTYIFDKDGNAYENVTPDDDGWENLCGIPGSFLTVTAMTEEFTPMYLGEGKYLEKPEPHEFRSDDEYIHIIIGDADIIRQGYKERYEFNNY